MKTLKTSKIMIAICWTGLSNTPPKDFPTVGEMDSTSTVLDMFKESVPDFCKLFKEGERVNRNILGNGELPSPDDLKLRKEWLGKLDKLEQEIILIEEELEFEDEEFNTFFQQFERWGKNWFAKLEQYLEFRKQLNSTNQQPKDKSKKK